MLQEMSRNLLLHPYGCGWDEIEDASVCLRNLGADAVTCVRQGRTCLLIRIECFVIARHVTCFAECAGSMLECDRERVDFASAETSLAEKVRLRML